MEAQSQLNILEVISREEYSESNLISSLRQLFEENERGFVEVFLQFILDCAEIPFQISLEIDNAAFLVGSESTATQFLLYRDPTLATATENFLQVYITELEAFQSDLWRKNVVALLKVLVEVEDEHKSNGTAGLYFVVRLLINGCCVRNCQRMTPFDFNQLDDFCYSLMDLYDFELLMDDNFEDITQKLIYLFQFYWEFVLAGDPTYVKYLTGLLLIDKNSLKKDILKTVTSILSSPNLTPNIRQAILNELLLLKDILIAMCHNEPYYISIEALSVLAIESKELIRDSVDGYKIFILMSNSKDRIKQLAKQIFMECVKRWAIRDNKERNYIMLKTLDNFITGDQNSTELAGIVDLLQDELPSFIDMYLYIVQHTCKVIHLVVLRMVELIIKNSSISENDDQRLLTIISVSSRALEQASLACNWNIHDTILHTLISLPDRILRKASVDILDDIADHLAKIFAHPGYPKDNFWGAAFGLVNLKAVTGKLEDMTNILDKYRSLNNWSVFASLCEVIAETEMDTESGLIDQNAVRIAAAENAENPTDHLDILFVQALIILRNWKQNEDNTFEDALNMIQYIQGKKFLSQTDDSHQFLTLAKMGVHLFLITDIDRRYKSVEVSGVIKQFGIDLLTFLQNWATIDPKGEQWPKSLLSMVQFSEIWLHSESLPKLFETLLLFPETRSHLSECIEELFQNHRIDEQEKSKWFIKVLAETLQLINLWSSKTQSTAAAKQLLEILYGEFKENQEKLTDYLVHTLIQCLRYVGNSLTGDGGHSHRFRTMDVLLERIPRTAISTANRRKILTLTGDIVRQHLSDAEAGTIRKIINDLH